MRLLSRKEPTKGQDITLTLDKDVQLSAFELLRNKVGTIVVMDIDNGEILGMVSSPSFEPNSRTASSPHSPYVNRAIQGQYPPASVFKTIVALGGLDSRKVTTKMQFMCKGSYELGGIKFKCPHIHGSQNLLEAIAHSCNIYFYNLGLALGADQIHRYAKLFGLGELTHIDLPYEALGYVSKRNKKLLSGRGRWYSGDTLNFSIGQGDMLVTPLQLVRMMATVARKGYEIQPHLIKEIGYQRIQKFAFERKIKMDEAIYDTIQKGLRATVTDYTGTAHVLDLKKIYVAGKTGTVQISSKKRSHAWFVGYAKGERRNIAFCVFLEHGGSSQNACLVARQLLLKMHERKIL